jgi:glycosidase
MPWSAEPQAGFSESDPWLPLPSDFAHFSVAMQQREHTSTLRLYQQLITLRHASPALQHGSFSALTEIPRHVFAYRRSSSHQTMLIALNFDSVSHTLELPDKESAWAIQLSTHLNREDSADRDLVLHPYEGVLLERFDTPTAHLNTGTTQ